jgi:hypothetical protein
MANPQIPDLNPGRDYPLLRAYGFCPLCHEPKSSGLLCCWQCFNRHDVAGGKHTDGNCWAEARFARVEANLMTAAAFAERYPAIAAGMS